MSNLSPVNYRSQIDSMNYRPKVGYCSPITVAIGAITFLSSVFLLLAAYQILPHGLNAMSNLGFTGKLIGYSGLGLGTLISLTGMIKCFLTNKTLAKSTVTGRLNQAREKQPEYTSVKKTPPTSTRKAMTFVTEDLPPINSKMQIFSMLQLDIGETSLVISGKNVNFGAITENERDIRILACLLQKNSVLLEAVMSGVDSQSAIKNLAESIRKDLPLSVQSAGLCIVDNVQKTYSVELFGETELRVVLGEQVYQDSQHSYFDSHTIFIRRATEDTFLKSKEYIRERYHARLPEKCSVQFRRTWGASCVSFPHPDHLGVKSTDL